MKALLIVAAVCCPAALLAADYKFEPAQRVLADGKVIETEEPGFAAPCLADIDGDGIADLLVGQFNDGKIAVYKGAKSETGKLSFGGRQWLQAGGEDAVVPGVW